SFLELFYDLVYVVLIAEISHGLAGHLDPGGLAQFAFLFVLVWLAWVNGSLYHDFHGHDDIRTRVYTFLQMGTVASMAVFAHSAFGPGGVGFALSFAAYQLLLTSLWWQSGVHDVHHRPLSTPYSAAFLLSATMFGVSAFVDASLRNLLWGLGLLLSIAAPIGISLLRPKEEEVKAQLARSMEVSASAVERFALLTLIVLGEVIVGVVRGVAANDHPDMQLLVAAALGLGVAFSLWWLYFDFVSTRHPHPGPVWTMGWMYLHLVVTMGIVVVGAGTLNVIEHAGEPLSPGVRLFLTGALVAVLVGTAGLMRTLKVSAAHAVLYRKATWITLGAAGVVAVLGAVPLSSIPLLAGLLLVLLLPVLYGVQVWIDVNGEAH
ncbi:MAG TPA: low temperature requirement protein A, partial [Myxococcota bacterium]|nr:low temperature requirement protein A [Myxococcota bacterium]